MMKRFQKILWRVLPAALFVALFVGLNLVPLEAKAWTTHTSHYSSYHHSSSWDYDDRYEERKMQSERIASQEEAAREKGREKRREEVAAAQKAGQHDYLESQQAIRDASRAASSSPRGSFYRKPGSTTMSLPGSRKEVEVSGKTYNYVNGIFYLQIDGKTHIVVPAPVGAVVDTLPEGSQAAVLNGKPIETFYYFGTFFAQKDGKYEVVQPPQGAVVSYVPEGYQEAEAGDSVQYNFGGIRFSPVLLGQTVVYQVAGAS